jgi:ATP-dependent DNA helicase PIF1
MLVKDVDEMLVNGCVGKVVGFFKYREVMGASHGGENDNKRTGAVKSTGFVRNVRLGTDGGLVVVTDTTAEKENIKNGESTTAKGKLPLSHKEKEAFPVVEFPTPEGGKETVLVMREEFKVEDSEDKTLARRMQVGSRFNRTSVPDCLYLLVADTADPRMGHVDP